MKLAEALLKRKDLGEKMSRLNERLVGFSTVNENQTMDDGTKAAAMAHIEEISKQMDDCFNEYEDILVRINRTNIKTLVDGESLTKLMVRRQNLKREMEFRQQLWNNLNSGSYLPYGMTMQIEGFELTQQKFMCSKELRLLNEKIQWTNWNTELM